MAKKRKGPLEISIDFDEKQADRILKIIAEVPDKVSEPAMELAANFMLEESRLITPWDTRLLQTNSQVIPPEIVRRASNPFGRPIPVEIRGGFVFLQVYAAAQHEGLDFHHPNGGQAKFAETILKDKRAQRRFVNIVAEEVSGAL